MCQHRPPCPSSDAADRDAAIVVARHSEQGWSLLCNGVIAFDDCGDLLPDGRAVPPPAAVHDSSGPRPRPIVGRTPAVPETPAPVRRARCGRLLTAAR